MSGSTEQTGRSIAIVPLRDELGQDALAAAMGEFGMSVIATDTKVTIWGKPSDTREAYPLFVDTEVDEDARRIILRGFVFDEDGSTRLSLDGDDGVTHHAKSGALGDFEGVIDQLGQAMRAKASQPAVADQLPEVDGMPSLDGTGGSPSPTPGAPAMASQPIIPASYPQVAQGGSQWGGQATQSPSQAQAMPAYAPYQQPAPQPQQQYQQHPSQAAMAPQIPQQPSPSTAQPRQFGYGAEGMQQQQASPQGIAPGWAVQSVPDRCWAFIAISCVELILLMAESTYVNLIISLVPIALLSWPAIPAIVYSFAYKNAFQQGNAQLAMAKMRLAKGWIIGAGIWCLVRIMFKLAFCSYY